MKKRKRIQQEDDFALALCGTVSLSIHVEAPFSQPPFDHCPQLSQDLEGDDCNEHL